MEETLQTVVSSLHERYGVTPHEFRDQVSLIAAPEHILEVARALRDDFQFNMLIAETAVDYWPEEAPRFHVIYQIYSMTKNVMVRVRVPLDGNAPHLQSIESIYPNANWYEREVFDMFGVIYDGHSDLRRIIMPADWQGHPLRKDYPLGYEESRFTFNYTDIDRRKPLAKE